MEQKVAKIYRTRKGKKKMEMMHEKKSINK